MQSHLLTPGTLLDERYRIQAVLGEGGFGITYAAENVRIGLKVAVKELFWRGHSSRNAVASPEVMLEERDRPVFLDQKERFLREARIIRDFSNLAGIAHILDYFEDNATAYIVMEYVEGETLAAHLEKRGKIPAEELFRRVLPLTESLMHIHESGVIHRDISPDNIMVQPDGSLKLIDFGAARAYHTPDARYTTIAKDSYAPGEQYDKNGKQGPWTDVYALCATMYSCICGVPPVSAVQRLFLDELQSPTQLGAEIAPPYEAIIMKGLQMNSANRQGDMRVLSDEIRAALPAPKPEGKRGRSLLIAVLAGVLCAGIVLGGWFYQQYKEENKFRGIETEKFILNAPEDMTAADFAAAQTAVEKELAAFAGEDNFILKVEGAQMQAELPLECFGGQEIEAQLNQRFLPLVGEEPNVLNCEMKANWEDPTVSLTPGENQVLPSALKGETVLLSYQWYDSLTRGRYANLLMDFKVRLDALDTPYALGTLHGNRQVIVIQISPERLNPFVVETLGASYSPVELAGECHESSVGFCYSSNYTRTLHPRELEDGALALVAQAVNHDEAMGNLLEALRAGEEEALYLQSPSGHVLAQLPLEQAGAGAELIFRDFLFTDGRTVDASQRWVVDYVDALVNQTQPPVTAHFYQHRTLDASGAQLLGEVIWNHYGAPIPPKPSVLELKEILDRIEAETPYAMFQNDSSAWIDLNLEPGEELVENLNQRIRSLILDYGLNEATLNKTIYFELTNRKDESGYALWLNTVWDYDTLRYVNELFLYPVGEGSLWNQHEEIEAWWNSEALDDLGLRIGNREE